MTKKTQSMMSTEQSSGNVDYSPGVQYLLADDEDHGRPVQSQKDVDRRHAMDSSASVESSSGFLT